MLCAIMQVGHVLLGTFQKNIEIMSRTEHGNRHGGVDGSSHRVCMEMYTKMILSIQSNKYRYVLHTIFGNMQYTEFGTVDSHLINAA